MEMQEISRRNENKGYNIDSISHDTTVDWRGRPSNPKQHGGMKAASFVLGNITYVYLPDQNSL